MVAAPNALQLVVNHLQSLDFKDTFDDSGVAVSHETSHYFRLFTADNQPMFLTAFIFFTVMQALFPLLRLAARLAFQLDAHMTLEVCSGKAMGKNRSRVSW